mgnify:CR=1 FL=1
MFAKFREPVSGLTHLFGVGISIVGLIILINYTLRLNNLAHITAFVVFGVSLILLYSASSVYHLVSASQKVIKVLRRIDHSMIYVLIAGSYTPICLIALRGKLGFTILTIIWCLAIFGILIKNFWFNAPRWLSTFFYIFMGWLVIVAIFPLARVLTGIALTWLVVGGISYTIGGIIYGLQLPKMKNKYFGSHEIFHIFVLVGSFCHYWLVLRYVSIM